MSTVNQTNEQHNESGLIIEAGILKSCCLRQAVIEVPKEVHTIGTGAFKGCTSLEQVILPDTVHTLSADAFKGCRLLSKVILPSKLVEIGDYAFHRCHNLKEIKLPATVTKLGNCVFLYCDSLETVWMPGVKSLGLQVFLNDVHLKNILISPELEPSSICDCFTGCISLKNFYFSDGSYYYMENAVDTMKPESDAPGPVRAIGTDICRMMEIQGNVITKFLTNIKHIELPEGIKVIGKSCFYDKKGIVSIKLPTSLHEIGSRAFRNCINLERVEFQSSDVMIHDDAFKNCTTLHYIRMADGKDYELSGLQYREYRVPDLIRKIQAQILGNFLISGTVLLEYRGSEERVVVPDGITVIGERAFAGNEAVDRVILPESVEFIEEGAFCDCLVLQTINFPSGIKKIGNSAFENCVKLIRAILPEELTEIKPGTFNRCRLLNEVHFGNHLQKIGDSAFYGCCKLKEATLPHDLKIIGSMAFYQCSSLREIVLPPSVIYLGSNVFTHSGIRNAVVCCNPDVCKSDVFSQCARLKRLTFQEGVRHIGNKFAFQCENLSFVDLPESVETIGRHTFEGSRYLKNLPEDKTIHHILLDGSSLSGDVVLKETIRCIAGGAFYGNTQLRSITLPEHLDFIGPYAFCGCTGLTHIVLPAGVTQLEKGVFSCCTALKTVCTANTKGQLAAVLSDAFLNCRSLEEIPSLEACSYIGNNAFSDCHMLNTIKGLAGQRAINSSPPSMLHIGDSAFFQTPYLQLLKKEAQLNSGYKKDSLKSSAAVISGILVDGSDCAGKLELPEGIIGISDYAFCGNDSITEIIFPNSLKFIGASAFSGCKSLKQVLFSSPLESLGTASFEKCINLTEIHCETKEIPDRAFSWCTKLQDVTFEKAETIGDEAFRGCRSLEAGHWKEIRFIGKEAFSGCENLSVFDFSNTIQIGKRAFERCEALKYILLPETITVCAHAFEDCGRLERLELASADHSGKQLVLESYGFSGCTALKEIIWENRAYELNHYTVLFDNKIPELIRRIYGSVLSCFTIDEAFSLNEYKNNGRFVAIPKGITRIGEEVFQDISRLKELSIPDSVEYIGPRAFDKTQWLEQKQSLSGSSPVIIKNIVVDAAKCRGEVVLPSDVKLVSGWAFANCIDLTSITFSNPRTRVEDHAFRNCIHLKKVVLSDGREYRLHGLSSLKEEQPSMVKQIFKDCYNCFKVDEQGVLAECTGNIVRITLPEGTKSIGPQALRESNLLTEIQLSKETEVIGAHAFQQCKWLESVKGTEYLKEIGPMAFSGCIRLENTGALNCLKSLGERAFENCTSLKEIVLPEGLEEIPERAFYRCHELHHIVLPSTLQRIGREAFAFCYQLTDLVLPEGLKQVEDRAFAWCHINEESL